VLWVAAARAAVWLPSSNDFGYSLLRSCAVMEGYEPPVEAPFRTHPSRGRYNT
jgi:hypothetical protein